MTYFLHYYGICPLNEYIEQDALTIIYFHFYAFLFFYFLQEKRFYKDNLS
jgi:hypothetical protein